jgi:hypothetical protein
VQAACPQCAQKIVVEDARAPERPFAVKCPKCQATVRFPGRPPAAAAGTAAAGAAAPPAGASGGEAPAEAAGAELRSAPVAPVRRDAGLSDGGPPRKVLVALPDRNLASALTQPLVGLGYATEVLDSPEEGGRLLEDGVFDVVIANRAAAVPGRSETLYQRVTRLGPNARRRIFLVLVGDEYKTGDGLQAFAAQADLVVNPRDAAAVEGPLLGAMSERARLYQSLLAARHAAGID